MNNYKQRADALTEGHQHIRRLVETLTALATHAHKRGDKTTTNHALEAMEQLTDLSRHHAQQLRALLHEIETNQPHERPNQ